MKEGSQTKKENPKSARVKVRRCARDRVITDNQDPFALLLCDEDRCWRRSDGRITSLN
jgi:hypothetical protein